MKRTFAPLLYWSGILQLKGRLIPSAWRASVERPTITSEMGDRIEETRSCSTKKLIKTHTVMGFCKTKDMMIS